MVAAVLTASFQVLNTLKVTEYARGNCFVLFKKNKCELRNLCVDFNRGGRGNFKTIKTHQYKTRVLFPLPLSHE